MLRELNKGKKVSLGYRVDHYDPRDYRYSAIPKALPVLIDNRSEVVRIMDQTPEGSCTGHAICAAAEFLYWRRKGQKVDLSQRWAYRKARENDPWPGENYHGSTLRAAVRAWGDYGICTEEFWPYEPYQIQPESADFNLVEWEGEPNEGAAENALLYPLQSYRRCLTPFDVKHAIHENGLVVVGATVHTGWGIWGEENIKYDETIQEIGGHAFILVGYNEIEKIYHVVNSWGKDWGQNGFGKFSYADARINIHDAWTVSAPSNES